MSFRKTLTLVLLAQSILISTGYAALYYRRVPFALALSHTDTVIVDYDLNATAGVHCTSDQKAFALGYNHKGYFKSTHLPVSLVSDHVPEQKQEKLADASGQFTINLEKAGAQEQRYQLQCDYVAPHVYA